MPPASLVAPSRLRAVVLDAAFAIGLLYGLAALRVVVRLATWNWVLASLATALMVRWAVAMATRRPLSPPDALKPTVGWAALMGVLNVPVAFFAATAVADLEPRALFLVPVAGVMGAPAGLMLGVLLGIGLCFPVVALMTAWQRPSPAAVDRALVIVGLWVAALSLLALTPPPRLEPLFDFHHGRLTAVPAILAAAVCLVSLAGLSLAWLAAAQARARRSFIARVARGAEPGFTLHSVPDVVPELPVLGDTPEQCSHVLHRRERPGEGAYRSATASWPVALVPARWIPETARDTAALTDLG